MSQTKETILLTALRLFAQNGCEAVLVSAIAGELGITKGALYRHYASKRDVFDQILRRMEQEDASKYGIFYEGLDPAEEAPFFMVNLPDPDKAAGLQGVYSDPACYFVPEDRVEAFDASFLPKVKEKRPGQLV